MSLVTSAEEKKKVDVGALWNSPQEGDHLHAGHMVVDMPKKKLPLATAAPGVQ